MRNSTFFSHLVVIIGVISAFAAAPAWAGDPASSTAAVSSADQSAIPASQATETAPAKLPYGAGDVLKLSRAQVSEDVIVNYVQNSGTIYTLQPQDIVYLKSEGVTDHVITAMMDQRSRVSEAAAQNTAQLAPPAVAMPAQPAYGAPDSGVAGAPAPTYVQPPTAEVQPAPSTVYVIPYPQATAGYYGYPYYSSYYGYYRGPYPYYYGGYRGPSLITIHAGFGSGFHDRGHSGGHFVGHSGGFHVSGRR